jgi:hypothetical protein
MALWKTARYSEPSTLDPVIADPENSEGVALLVSLKAVTKKAVRINITIQEDVLRQIDAFAEVQGLTRSGLRVRSKARD